VLIGFGAVNRELTSIISRKRESLLASHRIAFEIVGVCDSTSAVRTDQKGGFDIEDLLRVKAEAKNVAGAAGAISVQSPLELATHPGYDVLVEATLANSEGAEPGLSCIKAALESGRCVVLANKGPLVKDFANLHCAADAGRRMAYSATVCGGLPVLNVLSRDMPGADISRIEGVFNSTTNYILAQMAAGGTYEGALREAQRLHIAEAEPSLDVDGWDTAYKLLIIANTALGISVELKDVAVQGVRGVTPHMTQEAAAQGQVYKLIATAQLVEGVAGTPDAQYTLEVAPKRVSADSFIGGISGWEMGVVIDSDLWERLFLKIDEPSVIPTSAAVLRDIVRLGGHSP